MKPKNEKNEEILFGDTYEVDITAFPFFDANKKYKSNSLWGHKKGIDFLFDIFWVIKNETDDIVDKKGEKVNKFQRTLTTLINEFISEFKEKGDLEEVITKYINELRKFKFETKREGSYRGAPDFEFIELSIDQIKESLYDLRRHKIQFYKVILEEYKKGKDKYNKILKEQLDWIQKGFPL